MNTEDISLNPDKLDEKLAGFIKKEEGFFIEVGAGDGVAGSNTLYLENIGWQGILIEPVIEQCAQCRINRPKAAVLNYDCIDHDYHDEPVKDDEVIPQGELRRVKGNHRTLTSIIEEFEIEGIDLLALNVGGYGLNILKGLDFSRYRPEYILIEKPMNSEILSSLTSLYYEPLEEITRSSNTRNVLYRSIKNKLNIYSDGAVSTHPDLELIEKAWDIAAKSNASYPGKYIAYYSLSVNGKQFPGERPWEDRWEYIGKAMHDACGGDFNGKRILELGCNLGLLSVWAAKEGAICHGYEHESDILEGCRLMASAFGVADRCSWTQADFNSKIVTDKIADDFDVCTCLSVMNWVRNKDNLIDLLSRQKKVVYEGHEDDEIEIGRLRRAGFTNIRKVAISERKRGVFVADKDSEEKSITWDKFEDMYGLVGAPYEISRVGSGDGPRLERIYFNKDEVWKVRLSVEKNPAKFASPHQETRFLQRLKNTPNVCRFKEYIEKPDHTIVILEHFSNMGNLAQANIPPQFRNKVKKQKEAVIKAVNDAGILHNDMFDRNFLISPDYDICLIDFDQAQWMDRASDYEHGYYCKVPRPVFVTTHGENKAFNLQLLKHAWDIASKSNASSPGKYLAYYSLDADGEHFPGERIWIKRWEHIGKVLHDACGGDLKDKRILELGCNLGLVSIWAAQEGAICHGYECHSDILEACKLVADAFGVADRCSWSQTDFNKKTDTENISDEFDVCTCLSLMNWVRDKENLISLLSRQRAVIYEGHESDEIETGRLKKAGFSEIKKVAVSARGRSVFLARNKETIERNTPITSNFENNLEKNQQNLLSENAKKYPQFQLRSEAELSSKINNYKWYHSIKINENLVTPGRDYEQIWDIILKGMIKIDFNNKKVLDIGCRDGLFSFKAEELGASEIIGIDNEISRGAVDFLIPLFNSKVKMFEINIYDIRKKDFGTFDIVLFPGVLYHLRFPFWALKKIADLLNEDGILLVETALCNVENSKSILYCPSGKESPYEPTSVSFFNIKGLIDNLKAFGLHVVNQDYSTEKNSNIFRQVVLARKDTIGIDYTENKFGYTNKTATKEVVEKYWYGKGQKFYE